MLAQRTPAAWMGKGSELTGSYPRELIAALWQERQLGQEFLRNMFDEHLKKTLGQPLQEALYQALEPLMDDEAEESDFVRASQAFGKLVVLLGRPGTFERDHLPTIPAALQTKVQELASQADSRLATSILALIEQPGLRVGGTEEAIRLLRERLCRAITKVEQAAIDLEADAARFFAPIHQQLLASTSKSSARTIQKALLPAANSRAMKHWALARFQGQVLGACAGVYRIIVGNVPELVREVTAIRSQLVNFLKQLDVGGTTSEIDDGLSRPVFPDGTNSIRESATLLLDSIRPDELREFDKKLQGRICHECRGVTNACNRSTEFGAAFLHLLTEQASRFLETRLPAPTASPILKALAETADAGGKDRIADLLDRATPGDLGQGKPTLTVIGVPASAEAHVDRVRTFFREEIHVAPSDEDFMIWRESCRENVNAFTKLCEEHGDHTQSAHSRSDVDWLPLS